MSVTSVSMAVYGPAVAARKPMSTVSDPPSGSTANTPPVPLCLPSILKLLAFFPVIVKLSIVKSVSV